MTTHLDLFSGIGGFAIAAKNCGFTTIGFCEREPYAQQILKERFGAVLADAECNGRDGSRGSENASGALRKAGEAESGKSESRRASKTAYRSCARIHPDIFTLNGADYAGVDLITGGFPCQPFSVAGKRRGAADDRALWPEMLRVIREAQPTWIIGENVAGIVTMELDNILSDLEGIGYAAWPIVVPACAVDARHRRDRVWIVAHANERRGEQCDKNERGFSKPDPECAGLGEDVADAEGAGLERREQHGTQLESELGLGQGGTASEALAHANGPLTQGNQRPKRGAQERAIAGQPCQWRDESEWFAESGMGRVAHGIPNRAHRLRGLGNAIVPQVAEMILRGIVTVEAI